MGRGLEAILSVSAEGSDVREDELREVPVELISPNPKQPRRRFDQAALTDLAGSLGERGVLQPVLVRPKAGGTYELIAGERRWRAARIAGLKTIPTLALIENMAREDLNPVEEARACAALVEELALTREQVGRRVGRSRVAVSNLMRLLDLPDEVVESLAAGELTEGHGRALLLAEDHGARRKLAREAVAEGWSVRTVEARARQSNGGGRQMRAAGGKQAGATAGHPDQEHAAREIAEVLGAALGAEVHVKASRDGGYRAELRFSTPEEAAELARRLRLHVVT
jgi:ParB family chromosome partitioning protein